jgi:uncharacterized membrane protein YccC
VIIRPGTSLPSRTVNRLAGTLAGTFVAALIVFALGGTARDPWILAGTAAGALAFAVAAVSRLYAFTVAGLTCSALLSASIVSVDPAYPVLRLADTVIGVTIAVVFGHLLWPRLRDRSASAARDQTRPPRMITV